MNHVEDSYTVVFPRGWLLLYAATILAIGAWALLELTSDRVTSGVTLLLMVIWGLVSIFKIISTNRVIVYFDNKGLQTPSTGFISWKRVMSLDRVQRIFGRYRRPYLKVTHIGLDHTLNIEYIDLLYSRDNAEKVESIARGYWNK